MSIDDIRNEMVRDHQTNPVEVQKRRRIIHDSSSKVDKEEDLFPETDLRKRAKVAQPVAVTEDSVMLD